MVRPCFRVDRVVISEEPDHEVTGELASTSKSIGLSSTAGGSQGGRCMLESGLYRLSKNTEEEGARTESSIGSIGTAQ